MKILIAVITKLSLEVENNVLFNKDNVFNFMNSQRLQLLYAALNNMLWGLGSGCKPYYFDIFKPTFLYFLLVIN